MTTSVINRSIFYIVGPGHGGPALVAQAYLEGTYSELYPNISQDEEGMQQLFKQFSFPGGIPSHVSPEKAGKDASRPNMVTGGNVQIVWKKFMRYFDVEPRIVPLKPGNYGVQ